MSNIQFGYFTIHNSNIKHSDTKQPQEEKKSVYKFKREKSECGCVLERVKESKIASICTKLNDWCEKTGQFSENTA